MIRKLVGYDRARGRYDRVDQVALRRTARRLLERLTPLLTHESADDWKLSQRLLPTVRAAIAGQIIKPVDDSDLMGGAFTRLSMEGQLPEIFDEEFKDAFFKFAVTALAMPLDRPFIVIKWPKCMALVEFEEEGDWPDKVKHP